MRVSFRKGYLMELHGFTWTTMADPRKLTNWNNTSIRGEHASATTLPLTDSLPIWGLPRPIYQVEILCIGTVAGHWVIEVGKVKSVSGPLVHPKTLHSGYQQQLKCQAGYPTSWSLGSSISGALCHEGGGGIMYFICVD